MRAIAVTPAKAGSAQQLELPKPRLETGMALMRVLEVGIDGTDTEINNGEYGEAPPGSYVLVIGHEALSVVDAVGASRPATSSCRPFAARTPAQIARPARAICASSANTPSAASRARMAT